MKKILHILRALPSRLKIKVPAMPGVEGKKLGEKARFYSWVGLNVLALTAIIYFTLSLSSFYSEEGKYVVDDGKRVVISVQTGEIKSRAKPIETEKAILTKEQFGPPMPAQNEKKAEGEEAKGAVKPNEQAKTSEKKEVLPGPFFNKRIAVVFTNVGLNETLADAILTFPKEVTISLSPYTHNIKEWVKKIRDNKFELLLDIPMETEDYPLSDPGAYALLTNTSTEENIQQLNTLFGLSSGFLGVVAPIGEKFTLSLVGVSPLLNALKQRNLFFIYLEKPSNDFLKDEAKKMGIPLIGKFVLADEVLYEAAIKNRLEEAFQSLKDQDDVVIVARAYPVSIKTIQAWMKAMTDSKSATFVPVSKLVKR